MSATVLHGDCIEQMRAMDDACVDAIVTDPPYELGFMGKGWDASGIANSVEMWREAYRVLKPGGHMLAFSATRTQHRMVCAIEDAGFEVRDQIYWHYGSGFPKSLDVSKAIDKAGGMSPKDQAGLLRQRREAANLSRDEVAAIVGCTASSVRDWEEGRARAVGRSIEHITPSEGYRGKLADLLGYSADERRLIGVAIDRREDGTVYGIGHSGELREGGATPAAQQWAGWGTALKPATEPICVARKPLIGTVAANVLEHGTGAINIDACRIDGRERTDYGLSNAKRSQGAVYGAPTESADFDASKGRWPANVIHDGSDEVLAAFAAFGTKTSGVKVGGGYARDAGRSAAYTIGAADGVACYADSGTAARFFYSAKASKADRADSKHPTVKPLSLMKYLVKLITPPGGTVLDPFAGSGTTLQAAIEEGFHAIGIEREDEYVADIKRRLDRARKSAAPKPVKTRTPRPKKSPDPAWPTLFDLMECRAA